MILVIAQLISIGTIIILVPRYFLLNSWKNFFKGLKFLEWHQEESLKKSLDCLYRLT